MNKFCITFAGAPGSSKTPIAYLLSQKFNLPIFNNDTIRTEVMEDLGSLIQEEYIKRRDQRFLDLIESGKSFIFDASVDRTWQEFSDILIKNEYQSFIISMDLSKALLSKLYQIKDYKQGARDIDHFLEDHQAFLDKYGKEVTLSISDQDFSKRLELALIKFSEKLTSEFISNEPKCV